MIICLFTVILGLHPLAGPLALPESPEPEPAFDTRFRAPPTQPKWGPKLVIATGALLVVSGVVGMAFSEGCRTRDDGERCVDPRAGSVVYPTLLVSGIAATITGSFWYRRVDR